MNRTTILAACALAVGLFACERNRMNDEHERTGTTAPAAMMTSKAIEASELKWGPAPPGLPSAAQAAVVDGDPSKAGVFVVRLKAPDGYTIAPHNHPTWERLTILSGTFKIGMGDKLDESMMKTVTAGGFVALPPGHSHYAKTSGETVIQITSEGPFQIHYIDPRDDPRRTAGGSEIGGVAAPR